MSLYDTYTNYLKNQEKKDESVRYKNFKNDRQYTIVLEHVSMTQGYEYLQLILSEYKYISKNDILKFVQMNDYFGNTTKYEYEFNDGSTFSCSPTSLRYIYQTLLILDHYKTTKCRNMVEVGCGYGGLFLCINYFSKLLNIDIEKYHMIDLPEPINLIEFYLHLHDSNIKIAYEFHKAETFGSYVPSGNLFFISNYCYTEIDTSLKEKYYSKLIKRVDNGFIIWQTICFNIEYMNQIIKPSKLEVEIPQTATHEQPNYYVYF